MRVLLLLLAHCAAKGTPSKKTKYDVVDRDDGTTFGILIDAGSTGSRVHIYQWVKRDFRTLPPPLTLPLTSERWTERIRPGLSDFNDDAEKAARTLVPLIETAKRTLGNYKHAWFSYPIYLKATAGMRELSEKNRDATIDAVRRLLKDNNTCPFDFANKEQARVIAGEEEAAYAWVAVNFVDGALLEATAGPFGTATPTRARGSMEMGGSSAQISFYKPEQDILAGLFKLQLGGRSHINIYAHSFLHYGRVSSRRAYWEYLAKKAGCWTYDGDEPQAAVPCVVEDHCLVGSDPHINLDKLESVTGIFGLTPPLHFGPVNANVTIKGTGLRSRDRYATCKEDVRAALFDVQFNHWCEYSHHGQCAFAGVYQPSLPTGSDFGNFVLLGNYVDLFASLGLEETTNVHGVGDAALRVCGDADTPFPAHKAHSLADDEVCFVAAYAYETFVSGHGFDSRVNFTTVTETTYNGATVSVGWQLGAMLYEINALPWSFDAGPNCSVATDAVDAHGLFLYTRSPLGGGLLAYALVGAVCVAVALFLAFRRKQYGAIPGNLYVHVSPSEDESDSGRRDARAPAGGAVKALVCRVR